MPICIAGMHRSGTSMIARLLNLCGLNLGPADRLLKPAPDNPEGFWESLPFIEINKKLLATLGGTWQSVPPLPPGWGRSEKFEALRHEAGRLPGDLSLDEPWGWKDPRNSLTLPFWKSIWPDLRVVICVRNPLDVANSLLARDQLPIGQSLRLWFEYHRALLDAPSGRRIVTHYDSYFLDPVAEMQRLLAAVGMSAEEETIEAACAEIAAGMRHNRFESSDLEAVGVPAEVIDIYRRLRAEAGPVFAADRVAVENRPGALTHLIGLAMRQEDRIAERERKVEELTQQIDALSDRLSARRYRYADKVATLARKAISSFQRQPRKRDAYAAGLS
jgi:hypothetical protein